jgi:hypothetical protein
MRRQQKFFFILLSIFILSGPLPSKAEQTIVLSEQVKSALTKAKRVSGPNVDQSAFDGRPVLVTFFASW